MAIKTLVTLSLVLILSACVSPQGGGLKELFALRSEAETLYQQGDYAAALEVYRELTQRVPEHTYSWFRLGNCHAQLSDHTAAVSAYQTVLAQDPTFSRAWLNLAYVQAQQLADTVMLMYQQVPPGDPQTQRIYTLVEGVLAPFGDAVGDLPDLSAAPAAEVVDEPLEIAEEVEESVQFISEPVDEPGEVAEAVAEELEPQVETQGEEPQL